MVLIPISLLRGGGYRSATTLGLQDLSQLKKDYGHDQADVIMNIVGNVISVQVSGDTAKQLSERFGKIMQDRTSISITSEDTSTSTSKQLDYVIPVSKIATLSSDAFVGMVADNPDNKINLKVFNNEIQNDHQAIKLEEENYKSIPVVKNVSVIEIQETYAKIKQEISNLFFVELAIIKARNEARNIEGELSMEQQAKEIINVGKPKKVHLTRDLDLCNLPTNSSDYLLIAIDNFNLLSSDRTHQDCRCQTGDVKS